jgi:hypothetical protein
MAKCIPISSGRTWSCCPRPTDFSRSSLGLQAVVRRPAHAGRFRREFVFVLGGTAPLVVRALGYFASLVQAALIRLFALRGVSQAVAQPAPEISPAIDLPASPTAFQATQPLPAEHRGRVRKWDELVDVDRRPVANLSVFPLAGRTSQLCGGGVMHVARASCTRALLGDLKVLFRTTSNQLRRGTWTVPGSGVPRVAGYRAISSSPGTGARARSPQARSRFCFANALISSPLRCAR